MYHLRVGGCAVAHVFCVFRFLFFNFRFSRIGPLLNIRCRTNPYIQWWYPLTAAIWNTINSKSAKFRVGSEFRTSTTFNPKPPNKLTSSPEASAQGP